MLTRKRVILAKKEVSYGVDPTPTGAANAVQASNITIAPLETIDRERDVTKSYLGNNQSIVAGQMVRLSFSVEIAGAGTAGNAPAYAPLIEACGFDETLTPVTDAVYAPISEAIPSLTLYFNLDGTRHKLLGARASRFGLRLQQMELPMFTFEFVGLYADVADATLPTPTLTGYKQPLAVNNANSSGFALHGYSGKLYTLEVDMGLRTTYRNLVGEESVQITDRRPQGRIVIDAVAVATKDFWTIAKNSTLGALTILHGTASGNKVQIDAPKVQIIRPTYGDQDGVATFEAALGVNPNAGDDELVLKVF